MADCVNQLRQLPGINKGFTDLHPRNSLCHPETDSRRQLGELSELEVAPFHTLHPNIKVIAKDKHFEDSIYFQQCDVLSYAFTAASAPLVASQSCSCRERRTLKYRKKTHGRAGGLLLRSPATSQAGKHHDQNPRSQDYDAWQTRWYRRRSELYVSIRDHQIERDSRLQQSSDHRSLHHPLEQPLDS